MAATTRKRVTGKSVSTHLRKVGAVGPRIARTPKPRGVATAEACDQALATLRETLEAIPESKLIAISTEPRAVGQAALERVAGVRAYLPQIARLPDVNMFWVNSFESIALALLAADAHVPARGKVPPELRANYQEALSLRQNIQACLMPLIARGLLPSDCLEAVVGAVGYRNVGRELTVLDKLLTSNAALITSKTPITTDEIARCKALARQLSKSDSARDQFALASSSALLLRRRAYTLLMWAYNEVRRCVRFLDPAAASRVVPTLFPSRKRGKGAGG